jgi:tetratricopeptide (TPR) repeat protein
MLLQNLSQLWRQDGNLLKAVAYLDQAAAEAEKASSTPAKPGPPRNQPWFIASGAMRVQFTPDLGGMYQELADLNRQLGRQEAAQMNVRKLQSLATLRDDSRYAWFLARFGGFEEAAAMFRRQIDRANSAGEAANTWQQLASLYAGAERYDEAIATVQKGLAALPADN